jgi:hypothetical protein
VAGKVAASILLVLVEIEHSSDIGAAGFTSQADGVYLLRGHFESIRNHAPRLSAGQAARDSAKHALNFAAAEQRVLYI